MGATQDHYERLVDAERLEQLMDAAEAHDAAERLEQLMDAAEAQAAAEEAFYATAAGRRWARRQEQDYCAHRLHAASRPRPVAVLIAERRAGRVVHGTGFAAGWARAGVSLACAELRALSTAHRGCASARAIRPRERRSPRSTRRASAAGADDGPAPPGQRHRADLSPAAAPKGATA